MSVVPYEGVVATPRIVDLGGRRSRPGVAIMLPIARRQASPSVRLCSSPVIVFEHGSGAIRGARKTTQVFYVSSRAAAQVHTDLLHRAPMRSGCTLHILAGCGC